MSFMEWSRRQFLHAASAVTNGLGVAAPQEQSCRRGADAADNFDAANERIAIDLEVNGEARALHLDPRTTLLDALRDHLGLTGTKKGCDMGACGACTVHIDGRRALACLTLAASASGKAITTIEGLASHAALHPVQAAFLEHDAFQCGFCTPGQIMSAVALIAEGHAGAPDEIREFMGGNICRCGAYPNIVAAIEAAAARLRGP
jgi:xanthine dehydrogenase YagT iron-sulfur-binding subunit